MCIFAANVGEAHKMGLAAVFLYPRIYKGDQSSSQKAVTQIFRKEVHLVGVES